MNEKIKVPTLNDHLRALAHLIFDGPAKQLEQNVKMAGKTAVKTAYEALGKKVKQFTEGES